MKKSIIALSAIAALSSSSFAAKVTHADMMQQIEALKAQIAALENKVGATQTATKENKVSLEKMMNNESSTVSDARFKKLEKKVARVAKTAQKAKSQSAGDNLKWNVDFRTQVDSLEYKMGNGTKVKNSSLLTNRLWLGMKYAADENSIFYGTLAYNKVFGDNRAQVDDTTTGNNASFDWVTNEAANNDNELKVKEAYWLYRNDSFLGNSDIAWTASVGRRPSTDGLGINVRADQQRKSALSHTVNVEFDGASARFDLDKITGIEGMWLKFCAGRGLTNSKLRFSSDGLDYTEDDSTQNVDMAGFIFVPWDNGQYSVHMNYSQAWNLIGMENRDGDPTQPDTGKFEQFGDMQYFTTMFKADGIGDGISDFLDDTIFFASYAQSKTDPNDGNMMLGSSESQTGHSYWIGLNMPDGFTEKGRIGLEWNKGSKYWRSMTYGEDTAIGSKIAARGTAWELYYNNQLTKALSASLKFTKIDYDYTGSNGFFGDMGTPVDSNSANAANAVKEAQNISAYVRYRF